MSIRKYFIETYGCQMNVHDSERMAGMLEGMGYEGTGRPGEAEVILMNTCAVREKPERKLFSEIGRFRRLKAENPDLVIGVTGCMAPRESDTIRHRAPYVDLLLGPRSLHRLPSLIRQVQQQRKPVEAVDLLDDPTPLTPIRRASNVSAWTDIMFGCNYNCTFCAVPTARGRERSRRPGEILEEIEELLGLGYREVTLLGQTVNAYGRDLPAPVNGAADAGGARKPDFAWLLGQIDGLARRFGQSRFRIRFTSPHPQLVNARLIDALANLPTVCEHLHLPVQSGDDAVLRRMNRTYTVRRYLEIVDTLRERIPDLAITTDAIVGFPGETEEQFTNTLRLFERVRFDQAFMFAYSPRHSTEAANFADQIPEPVQKRRLQELIALQNEISSEKNAALTGTTFEVLVEGPSDKNPSRLVGRTRSNKLMIFEGDSRAGDLVEVRGDRSHLWGFDGTPLEAPAMRTPFDEVIPLAV